MAPSTPNNKRKREKTPSTANDAALSSQNFVQLTGGGIGLLTGCRIPKSYFTTSGFGESDHGGGVNPWETGSYDRALEDAGIQDFNIMQYTSVMPPESHEIPLEEANQHYSHGAVLEVIMSTINGVQGDRLSVGVGRAKVRRISDGFVVGGYAAEYVGHAREDVVRKTLQNDLRHIFARRYEEQEYELFEERFTISVREVEKAFGTVLAAICFTSYIHPVIPIAGESDDKRYTAKGGAQAGKNKKSKLKT